MRAVVRALASGTLMTVGGLLLWSLAPHAAGLQSHVVLSGSMQPRILGGDVVLTQPLTAGELRPGQVVLFADPEGGRRLMLHRLVAVDDDGALVTRGDANQSADSSRVAPSHVQGLARLRIPYVGLPVLWRHEGQPGRIAALVVLLGAATWVAGGGRAVAAGGPA